MTNSQDITKHCMIKQLDFSKLCVTKAGLFHILDKKQYFFISHNFIIFILSHFSTPNVLRAKTSENTSQYTADCSKGEKFCLQKTQVLDESNAENKGQRRLTDGSLICLMRLSTGQIDLCVFVDHNFSEADRHLSACVLSP